MPFDRLVRFLPKGEDHGQPLIGEPIDKDIDIGLATFEGRDIQVDVFSGHSILSAGDKTGRQVLLGKVLSPLSVEEVGTVRCIGLNYVDHAKEVHMDLPSEPTVFYSPSTVLNDPHPSNVVIPKFILGDDAADYESEFAIILGKACKNVSEQDAMQYILGQWCFSKGFDGSCVLGPAFIHRDSVQDLSALSICGKLNGQVVQKSTLGNLIFGVAKVVSFLSQGTSLPAGTLIITGTPAGVGWTRKPRLVLRDGDVFHVEISHGIGTLINKIVEEK